MAHKVTLIKDALQVGLVFCAMVGAALGAWVGWAAFDGIFGLLIILFVAASVRRSRDG